MQEYQYELNGLLMGAGTQIRVTEVQGLFALPDVVSSDTQRDDGDGEYSSGDETLAGRTISFSLALEADAGSADDLYEQLQAATSSIRQETLLKIQRPGRPERQVRVKIRRREFTSDAMFARGLAIGALELKALDSRIYSTEVHTLEPTSQMSGTSSGGVGFPLAMPLRFNNSAQSSNIGVVQNLGTYETPAVIQIHGPIPAPVLESIDTGEELVFKSSTSIAADEFYEINLDTHTIRVNGLESRASTLDRLNSNWFLLRPGLMRFRLRGSDTNYLGTFTMTWQDAWA